MYPSMGATRPGRASPAHPTIWYSIYIKNIYDCSPSYMIICCVIQCIGEPGSRLIEK